MPIKIPIKIPVKKRAKPHRESIKIRYLVVAATMLSLCLPFQHMQGRASAEGCPDLRVLFVRGSGEMHVSNRSYQALNAALGSKLSQTSLKYTIEDVPYPAIAVGFSSGEIALDTIGAAISGGNGFEFGRSVAAGVQSMVRMINYALCPNTKYVLAGYSQGSMVLHKVLEQIDLNRVIYAATFGDPKIYLPEGAGAFPAACRGQNLSDYRVHVPDCYAYLGILGPIIPFRAETLAGRFGTWCNKYDILCSSLFSIKDHASYVDNGLYEDASRVIFGKINEAFNLNSSIASSHDTAILIDSTGSMQNLINQYKAEALRLAKETLDSGGRVALYDYRDLNDPYQPIQHCNFTTCDLKTFERELNNITIGGGGDDKESMLSASMDVMESLEWKKGATKSLVVLTDAGFHSPDLDETSLEDVVLKSKSIDPVNFYVITNTSHAADYEELTTRTDGKVVTNLNELNLLTDYIMDRYDSLPRVDEAAEPRTMPTLSIDAVEKLDDSSARIHYSTDAPRTLVILNDTILGFTDQTELTISDLNSAYQNTLTLVPFTDDFRGAPVSTVLNEGITLDDLIVSFSSDASTELPKAPDSSKFKLGWIRLK